MKSGTVRVEGLNELSAQYQKATVAAVRDSGSACEEARRTNVRAKLEFAICLGSRFAAPPWARNSRWSVSRHLRCFGLAPLTLEGHRRPGSHLGTSDSTDGMATTCHRVFATSATTALLVAPGPSGSPVGGATPISRASSGACGYGGARATCLRVANRRSIWRGNGNDLSNTMV